MRIVLIGAGNVATHFGAALQRTGNNILQVYSRTLKSAMELGTALKVPYTDSLQEVVNDADLYLVMLSDKALTERTAELVKGREQALFVHTAGSIPLSVWEGKATRFGVCYPMQTFSKYKEVAFDEMPLFIEANSAADVQTIQQLAMSLSRKVYLLSSEERKILHLGAVFANNFTNHLCAVSAHLLAKHNIPFQVMLPLIEETVQKIHYLSPLQAQTGPAVRNDINVMEAQTELLADEPELQEIYRLLSENIQRYDKLRTEKN